MQVMVDIEALGHAPTGALLSIGALRFDSDKGSVHLDDAFHMNVLAQTAQQIGMSVDASTCMWWIRQNDKARKALFEPTPQHIRNVLKSFKNWYGDSEEVWAHAFDFKILGSAYQAAEMRAPWHYRDERDLRTLYKLAGGRPDMRGFGGAKHHPLHDAYRQALEVLECFRRISNRAIITSGGREPAKGGNDNGETRTETNCGSGVAASRD